MMLYANVNHNYINSMVTILVGGLEHGFFFHILGIIIIPTDELIFFRGVAQPPTRYRKFQLI